MLKQFQRLRRPGATASASAPSASAQGAGQAQPQELLESDLPTFADIPAGERLGRNVRDGYARGWGLEFGELKARIANDPLYQSAMALAAGRTIQSEANRMNVFLLLKFYAGKLPPGNIVEFGSFKGGSAIFMAKVCAELLPGTQVYGFDTFEGMPVTDLTIDAHHEGNFSGVDFAELESHVKSTGLTNLHFVRGLFEDTWPTKRDEIGPVRLCHIDCDIRSAVLYSYEQIQPQMVEGGYIVFDDALYSSCIGATEVVEETVIRRDGLNSEQVYPHMVFRHH